MDPASILGCIFVFTISVCILSWRQSRGHFGTRAAPEPAGAWPVIGHLRLLMGSKTPHITLGNLADIYGPAFSIQLGAKKTLVVSSWEVAKECLTTNDKAFSGRGNTMAVALMGYNYALFSFTPSGQYWREIRKITVSELLSNTRLELLKPLWSSEIRSSVKELYEICTAKSQPGKIQSALVELQQWCSDLNLNLSTRMVVGKRYFANCDQENEGDVRRFQKATRDFFYWTAAFMVGDTIPFLRWVDFFNERLMKRTAKELDHVLEGWLQEHKRNRLNRVTKDQDFMDVMLTVLGDKDMCGYKADIVNKATCLNMIFGGTDSTTSGMIWTISLILNNREVLKKLQDEIDIQVGKNKQVDDSDIGKLVYLQATVKEAMRLYPAATLNERESIEDCTVAGYHIPAGTRLILNTWKIQRDPNVWPNPEEFQPERFLSNQANVEFWGQDFEFIPFGAGRRVCPGISMVVRLTHLTLACLLQGFNFETPFNEPVDMTEEHGITNFKATPLNVVITPRLASNLY